jgi:hypothetical protein
VVEFREFGGGLWSGSCGGLGLDGKVVVELVEEIGRTPERLEEIPVEDTAIRPSGT